MKKVYSFNSELYKVTGVQKVLMDIHHAVCDSYKAKIVGTVPYEKVHKSHGISANDYIQWRINPFIFYKSTVFVHERKFLLLFWLLNHLLFQKIEVVYIHHNIFHNHRLLSVMPSKVVSISDRSTQNLVEYFKVPPKHIYKIHNCVKDENPPAHRMQSGEEITILYPARINGQKRQIEIVKHLMGKIDSRVRILFAGDGPSYECFKDLVKDSKQFLCLGFRGDVKELLRNCDYMMMFSKFEGLSIALIESTMCGVPIITNDVGGNLEIANEGRNAFVANDWDALIKVINDLADVSDEKYASMCLNSRKIFEEKFMFSTFKKKYLKLLENN